MKIALLMKPGDTRPRMNTLETTFEKLKALPAERVEEVAHYIDSLSDAPETPAGRFDDLAGCLSADEADRLEHAINESSERIETPHQGW
jgi:hypothetical protein